jgi:hypothetical protein
MSGTASKPAGGLIGAGADILRARADKCALPTARVLTRNNPTV